MLWREIFARRRRRLIQWFPWFYNDVMAKIFRKTPPAQLRGLPIKNIHLHFERFVL
jgi:hypothetical protein